LRFVTHLDVDEAGIDHAIACVKDFLQSANGPVSAPARSGGPY
jgi:hypothetical protein